jgi:hypothetical protein
MQLLNAGDDDMATRLHCAKHRAHVRSTLLGGREEGRGLLSRVMREVAVRKQMSRYRY